MIKIRGKFVIFIVLIGAILGSIIGYVLKDLVPVLDMGVKVGFTPVTFNFELFDFTIGLHFKITLAAIIGIIASFLLVDIRR
jgi:hypothetical protein